MTKKQGKKIDMYGLIVLFFAKYDAILKLYLPLNDQITLFKLKEKLLQSIRDEQAKGSKGKTMTKEMLLQIMVTLLYPMIETALAWAITTNNKDMIALFTVAEEEFFNGFNEAITLADNTIKGLEDNAAELVAYDITAAMITAAKNAEAAFWEAKEIPKQQQKLKKVATASLATEIKAADAILAIIDLLMSGKYGKTNPEMYAEYKADRRIGESVSRHTTITAHIYEDDAHLIPIPGASMSIVILNRTEIANMDGEASIVQFKRGDYTLLFKAKGFGDLEVPFSIALGKHLEINVVMKANKLYGKVVKNGVGVANCSLSIVDTNLSAVTDAFGDFELLEVPEGSGVVECSNENGDLLSMPYIMGNGKEVKMDFAY